MATRKKKSKPVQTIESKIDSRTTVVLILIIIMFMFIIGGYIQVSTEISELKTIMQHMDSHYH